MGGNDKFFICDRKDHIPYLDRVRWRYITDRYLLLCDLWGCERSTDSNPGLHLTFSLACTVQSVGRKLWMNKRKGVSFVCYAILPA